MKKIKWELKLGLALVLISAVLYCLHILVFKNTRDDLYYTLLDIAYLPLQVLLVTLVLGKLIEERDKAQMLHKMNMVTGVFFSEAGNALLKQFFGFNGNIDEIRPDFALSTQWTKKDFDALEKRLAGLELKVDAAGSSLVELKKSLLSKREFLLRLLENPNLLEHESFTNLMLAVFHLTEELENRTDPGKLSPEDIRHLSGDILRAYSLLIGEWTRYMRHLKGSYPYLFSLAVRLNPFDKNAAAEIR